MIKLISNLLICQKKKYTNLLKLLIKGCVIRADISLIHVYLCFCYYYVVSHHSNVLLINTDIYNKVDGWFLPCVHNTLACVKSLQALYILVEFVILNNMNYELWNMQELFIMKLQALYWLYWKQFDFSCPRGEISRHFNRKKY